VVHPNGAWVVALQRSRRPKTAERIANGEGMLRDGIASTEPPSEDGGELQRAADRERLRHGASTEPPSEDGGESRFPKSLLTYPETLQRSRRPKTAESGVHTIVRGSIYELQRSRRPKTAESPPT